MKEAPRLPESLVSVCHNLGYHCRLCLVSQTERGVKKRSRPRVRGHPPERSSVDGGPPRLRASGAPCRLCILI
jgi:hypothetical protein